MEQMGEEMRGPGVVEEKQQEMAMQVDTPVVEGIMMVNTCQNVIQNQEDVENKNIDYHAGGNSPLNSVFQKSQTRKQR
jgi:hypothetical protein